MKLRSCCSIVPLVKARRAIGFAWRSAEAPLRRAERAASWAMEFMMRVDGIGDGEWRLRWLKVLLRGEEEGQKNRTEEHGSEKLRRLTVQVRGYSKTPYPMGSCYWPPVLSL